MKDRTYKLYAPSLDERDLWMHTFTWICECNAFGQAISRKPEFPNTVNNVYSKFTSLTQEEKLKMTLTPSKLETRLKNIADGNKKPIDGDVRCIFELQSRLERTQ